MPIRLRLAAWASFFAIAIASRAGAPAPAAPEPRPYVGIQFADAEGGGARVSRVVTGSPAESAQLIAGDVVVVFAGQAIDDATALTRLIHAARAGERIEVEVVRAGDRRRFEIVVGARPSYGGVIAVAPAAPPAQPLPRDEPPLDELFGSKPKLGVQLVETTPELREHLGADADAGVLISKVLRGMPAERAGLEVGDIIVAVAGQPIATSRELVRALARRNGETFAIEIVRNRERRTVEVTLPDPAREPRPGPRV